MLRSTIDINLKKRDNWIVRLNSASVVGGNVSLLVGLMAGAPPRAPPHYWVSIIDSCAWYSKESYRSIN